MITYDHLTVTKTVECSQAKTLVFMRAIVKHFINNPDPMVVPLYSFKIIRKFKSGNSIYSYTMMKLDELSSAENEMLDRIGELHDKYGAAACILKDFHYEDQEKFPKLFEFLKTITLQGRFWDIHSGNILMDSSGNYRLIDIEGFLMTPLNQPGNDWISREAVTPITQRATPKV